MSVKSRKAGRSGVSSFFERSAQFASRWTGSSPAFALVVGIVVVWLMTGPYFRYSDTWQLVINTGTSVVTFLMVFLIQRSQNKEYLSIQLKLNEMVAALDGASNRLIDVERLTEADLDLLHKHYVRLAELTANEVNLRESHSVDEAEHRHEWKIKQTMPKSRKKPGE